MIAAALTALVVGMVAATVRPRHRRRVAPVSDRTGPHRWRSHLAVVKDRRRSATAPTPQAVAAWCDDLARELRSGSTLRQALATVVPDDDSAHRRTAAIRHGLERGRPVDDVAAMVDDPGPHLQLVTAMVAAAAQLGGSAAPAVDRVATTLRQRAADRDERWVQAAQARLSAHVMTAVPLLMLAVLVATDDDVRAVLQGPVGATCVAVGLALNAAGWCWMRRIVGVGQ